MSGGPALLENAIRPVVRSFPSPAGIGLLPRAAPEQVVAVNLMGSGGRTLTWTFSGGIVNEDDNNKFRESGRQSTKVRVENPDDAGQFVEFCRADKITLDADRTGKKPPRTSSFDTSGGYHDMGDGKSKSDQQTVDYKYPSDTTCRPTQPPKRGC